MLTKRRLAPTGVRALLPTVAHFMLKWELPPPTPSSAAATTTITSRGMRSKPASTPFATCVSSSFASAGNRAGWEAARVW